MKNVHIMKRGKKAALLLPSKVLSEIKQAPLNPAQMLTRMIQIIDCRQKLKSKRNKIHKQENNGKEAS